MYFATTTCPDIAYTAGVLARFNSNPGWAHWLAIKHLLCYIKAPWTTSSTQNTMVGWSNSTFATIGQLPCTWVSFSGRQGNDILELRRPGDHTSTHLDHISTSRVTSILAFTMVCIREHDKGLRLSRIRGIGNRVVNGTLNIAQEVFDSEPVGPARIGVQSSQHSNSVGDIWTSGGTWEHQ